MTVLRAEGRVIKRGERVGRGPRGTRRFVGQTVTMPHELTERQRVIEEVEIRERRGERAPEGQICGHGRNESGRCRSPATVARPKLSDRSRWMNRRALEPAAA